MLCSKIGLWKFKAIFHELRTSDTLGKSLMPLPLFSDTNSSLPETMMNGMCESAWVGDGEVLGEIKNRS
jgi:hypothetical protein